MEGDGAFQGEVQRQPAEALLQSMIKELQRIPNSEFSMDSGNVKKGLKKRRAPDTLQTHSHTIQDGVKLSHEGGWFPDYL